MNKNDKITDSKAQQMRKGMLGYAVLLSLQKGEAYSSTMLQSLKKADLLVVEGTLYPLLNRFKREGLLDYKWKESQNGPPRKYYSLTKEGIEAIKELDSSWKSLQKSINNISK